MGFFDRFKKDKPDKPDLTKAGLADLKKGWLVDYDLKTWEVTAKNRYDWGEDDKSYEWQLRNGDEVIYLELEYDDVEDWSVNRKISFPSLGGAVKQAIVSQGDPPEEIVYKGTTYYLEEMAGGRFMKDCQGFGQELLRWSYEDDEGDNYLGVEQWGEEEFEASIGVPAEEYQFQNILPRETPE